MILGAFLSLIIALFSYQKSPTKKSTLEPGMSPESWADLLEALLPAVEILAREGLRVVEQEPLHEEQPAGCGSLRTSQTS